MGRRGAVASLRRHGVGAEVAQRAVEESVPADEDDRATEIARQRLARLTSLDPEIAKRRLLGFLMRRGFDSETARSACRRAFEEVESA